MKILAQPVSDPFVIVCILLSIEGVVLLLADWRRTRKFFDYVPSMFWIYSLPMVANTLGLIPDTSGVYDASPSTSCRRASSCCCCRPTCWASCTSGRA